MFAVIKRNSPVCASILAVPSQGFLARPCSRTYFSAVALGILLLAPFDASARLHTGEVTLSSGNNWDFSDSTNGNFLTADIVYDVIVFGSEEAPRTSQSQPATNNLHAYPPAGLTYIGFADSVYAKLETAPTDPQLYVSDVSPFVGDVYVVRTSEGHYAKIEFMPPGGPFLKFRYTYQDDGTPSFLPPVSARAVTWGAVKSMFR